MVVRQLSREAAIKNVEELLSSVSPQAADVAVDEDEYEYRIDVRPKSAKNCTFWLGFSTYRTYGLCFGHGLAFEDLSLDEFPPDEVVTAILDGRVRETVWLRRGQAIKSIGEILLYDGRAMKDDAVLTPLGMFSIGGRKEDVAYAPYSRS